MPSDNVVLNLFSYGYSGNRDILSKQSVYSGFTYITLLKQNWDAVSPIHRQYCGNSRYGSLSCIKSSFSENAANVEANTAPAEEYAPSDTVQAEIE